jgi:hypothetical protein
MQMQRVVAVTACSYYSEWLKTCLSNKDRVTEWVIATSSEDLLTQELVKQAGAHLVIVPEDQVYNSRSSFNKGLLQREAQKYARERFAPYDWELLIDADILLPVTFPTDMERHAEYCRARGHGMAIYGCPCRILVQKDGSRVKDQAVWIRDDKVRPGFNCPIGFFQMYPCPADLNEYLVEESRNAGCDLDFGRRFPASHEIPVECYHYGNTSVNWDGIKHKNTR